MNNVVLAVNLDNLILIKSAFIVLFFLIHDIINKRNGVGINMTLNSILTIIQKIIDISLVWFVFYFLLKNLRNNVKMVLLFKGILFLIVIKIFSDWLNLVTIGLLLEYVIMWGPLALIIIFQPEIRNMLEHLGRSKFLGRHKVLSMDEREKMIYEIMSAVERFSNN